MPSTREGRSLSSFTRAVANLEDAYQIHADKTARVVVQSAYRAIFQAAKAVVLYIRDKAPQDPDQLFLAFYNIVKEHDKPQIYGEKVRFVQNLLVEANYGASDGVTEADAVEVRTFGRDFLAFCAEWIRTPFDPDRFAEPTT